MQDGYFYHPPFICGVTVAQAGSLTRPTCGNMAIESASPTPTPFVVPTILSCTSEEGLLAEAQWEDLGMWKPLRCVSDLLQGAFVYTDLPRLISKEPWMAGILS